MPTIAAYGKELFGSARRSGVLLGLNNAPGGEFGVDEDAQWRLGAPGSVMIKDREHGICAGILICWVVGLCAGRLEAANCNLFPDYFKNVLRFQGSYIQDLGEPLPTLDELLPMLQSDAKCIDHGESRIRHVARHFGQGDSWAMHLSLWSHCVGAGQVSQSKFVIMDPNIGLFEYDSKPRFEADLVALCEARRTFTRQRHAVNVNYLVFKSQS